MDGVAIRKALKPIQAAPGNYSPGQLELGNKVEMEHNKTVLDAIKKAEQGKSPAVGQVRENIALDHIKENENYYQATPGVEEDVLLVPATLKINKLTLKLASTGLSASARILISNKVAILRIKHAEAAEQWIRQEMAKLQRAINPNVLLDAAKVEATRAQLQADPNNWKLISSSGVLPARAIEFIS